MNDNDLSQQRSREEIMVSESESKLNEAKSSGEELINAAQKNVQENEALLASVMASRVDASDRVDELKAQFERANRNWEAKVIAIHETQKEIVHFRNCCLEHTNLYQAKYLELQKTLFLKETCRNPEERSRLETTIQGLRVQVNLHHNLMIKYQELDFKKCSELPSLEREKEHYSAMVQDLKPKLEEANRLLQEMIEKEKTAQAKMEEAKREKKEKTEYAQQKIQEAKAAHETALKIAGEWKSALQSASNTLSDYTTENH